jgi:hypothetical protein
MIPVNQADWDNYGDRTNWCTAQPFWTNENIYLTGDVVTQTSVLAGHTCSIVVGLQGVADGETAAQGLIQSVQAWATFPSPTAGHSAQSLVVPSMQTGATPEFTGHDLVQGVVPPAGYQAAGNYLAETLSNTWTPLASDQVGPANPSDPNSIHCCLIATSKGQYDVTVHSGVPAGTNFGTQVTGLAQLATAIDICDNPFQGQRNISILLSLSGRKVIFGFLAASRDGRKPTEVEVHVTPLVQEKLDPALLRALTGSRFRDLPLHPSPKPLKSLTLAHNDHKFEGPLRKLIHAAEDMIKMPIKEPSHPFPGTSGLKLRLPPGGVHPLHVELEVDPSAEPGAVHALDIIQTESDGRRGGIRLGVLSVPEELVHR